MPKGKGYSLRNPPASEVMKKKGGPNSHAGGKGKMKGMKKSMKKGTKY